MAKTAEQKTNQDLMDFIDAAATAAHTIAACCQRLDKAGFQKLDEGEAWNPQPGDSFYIVRGLTALVAGRVGTQPASQGGFRMAGSHSDFPGLRLKPNAHYSKEGYWQMGVEVYGGPLFATWVDRDLTLAGRLHVRQLEGPPKTVLVRGDKPLCRIPMHAIHFKRDVNDNLKFDRQKHLPPIYGLGDEEQLKSDPLLSYFADLANVDRAEIVAADLEVIDNQPPAIGGLNDEFIFAPHLDNTAGSHAVLEAILQAKGDTKSTSLVAIFDAEEIGSQTLGGAGSQFLDSVLERLCLQESNPREALLRALSRSLMVSVDGAHAVHPNYADYHDVHHKPALNGGPVIKTNALQRYATSAQTRHWFERCASRAKVPVQHYIHRTDMPCGSTIGPMTATRLGVETVDVGNPMLAMHSIRETGGTLDQHFMIRALLEHFAE